MARLSKEAYEGKERFAGQRMAENAKNENLNAEQHEVLSEICRLRHELHISHRSLFIGENADKLVDFLENWISNAKAVNLPTWDYCDVNVDMLPSPIDLEIDPEDWYDEEEGEDYQTGFSRCFEKACAKYSEINDTIESFLRKIDETFGTDYCPSGASRLF